MLSYGIPRQGGLLIRTNFKPSQPRKKQPQVRRWTQIHLTHEFRTASGSDRILDSTYLGQ